MMKRPLAMFERAMYVDPRFHVNVMVTARICGRIREQQMTEALAQVQAKHTILRCRVVHEDGRPYFLLEDKPAPIPLRIIERQGDDDWFAVSTQESLQRFDGSCQPLARVIWLRSEQRSELLLVCSHALCDGRSLVTLMREILLLCDQPEADIGSPTSLNGINEIFPTRILASRSLQRRIRWRVATMKLMLRFVRPGSAWTYGSIYRNLWTIDEHASHLLIARCKAEGTNVFSALATACMLAFRKVCGAKQIQKFEAPVDIRRYLPKLRSDSLFAIAPTVVLSLDRLRGVDPETADFWTMARALKQDMAARMDRLESTVYMTFLGMERMHDVYERMVKYSQSKRAGQQVSLSYVGRLDLKQDYQHFRIEEICDISAMMTPTPANLVAIYSFAGKFHFSLSSDESSLPYAQALAIKEQVTATLRDCIAGLTTPVHVSVAASSTAGAVAS
jgi:NRPS condensation-like uncharacterized protein